MESWIGKDKKSKEDLYIRVLLWAHEKQETGFTWEEMRNKFSLSEPQEAWVRKIFLTTNDGDRKFFENIRNDEDTVPNSRFSLNEKGITAAISYKGLAHAEKNSRWALWFSGIALLISAWQFLLPISFGFHQCYAAAMQGDKIIRMSCSNWIKIGQAINWNFSYDVR